MTTRDASLSVIRDWNEWKLWTMWEMSMMIEGYNSKGSKVYGREDSIGQDFWYLG